ncbi:MAG: DNA polymerase III subunit alpha, partial [Bacteroidota bacterium]
MQAKGVIREICRIFNIPFAESENITSLIPVDQVNPVTLKQAIELIPQLQTYANSPRYKKIFQIALVLTGIVRNFSKHAAGIIISDEPVWKMCPIFRDDKGDLVVQFEFTKIEYVGGIKFDFLGLRTLTILDETFKLIKKRHGVSLDFSNISTEDEETFKLFQSGNLDGIFQFDGAGIRDIVLQLKPDKLDDLIVLNALYRPGPIKNIPSYIKRKHKEEDVFYLHPLTENILDKTYGIMVYQEQVMDIAKVCAGYTAGEADLLRRAMGKKKPEEMIAQKDKFLIGCKKNDIPSDISEELFDLMSEFSGYGFNKSHSAPYALIAYVCGYLKAHYPREFLCCF